MKINSSIRAMRPSMGSLVYIISSDAGMILVDSGSQPGGAAAIEYYIKNKMHQKESSLKYIFLTHWHSDHAGAAENLRKRTGAKIVCLKQDAGFLQGEGEIDRFLGMPMPVNGLNPVYRGMCLIGYGFMRANTVPPKPDLVVEEGSSIFGPDWEVLHLPGHTPGSAGLWSPVQRVLFPGDTVMTLGNRLVRPLHFLIDDPEKLRYSRRRLRQLGEVEWLLPGHYHPLRIQGHVRIH